MRFDNGTVCQAPAQGGFQGDRLVIDDTTAVRCSDGSAIFRRITTCERVNDRRAECVAVQPERGSRSRVTFQR
jgi:hypothetical protein